MFSSLAVKYKIVAWCAMAAVGTFAARFLTAPPFDWNTFFDQGKNVPAFYPPWTEAIVLSLSYPVLVGITLASFAVAVMIRARSPLHAAIAFINLPLFWTIFLGQLDGLALLGTLGLPWLTPLVLLKPQVAAFAVFAEKRTIVVAVLFVLATFMVFGLWPLEMFSYHRGVDECWPQDIAGYWGIGLLVAFLIGRMPTNDVDWWMLAGACLTPALIPYNLLPLMPAIARLPIGWAAAVAMASWLPLLSNWVGDWGWQFGWVSLAILGVGLGRDKLEIRQWLNIVTRSV